jgi:hypothetical protein
MPNAESNGFLPPRRAAELVTICLERERREGMGESSLLTLVMREQVPVNCRRISQNLSPAGVTSPFVARAMPTRSSDKR